MAKRDTPPDGRDRPDEPMALLSQDRRRSWNQGFFRAAARNPTLIEDPGHESWIHWIGADGRETHQWPTMFLIDHRRIVHRQPRSRSWSEADLNCVIDELVKEAGSATR
jgi:hypothetical protein